MRMLYHIVKMPHKSLVENNGFANRKGDGLTPWHGLSAQISPRIGGQKTLMYHQRKPACGR